MIVIAFILGGIARALVGDGKVSRWAIYPPVVAISALIGHFPDDLLGILVVLWVTVAASLNMAAGYTNWESWKHMVIRLGIPALILVAPLLYVESTTVDNALMYVLLCVFVGLAYPHRAVFEKIPGMPFKIKSFTVDSARIMEFISGALILGGVALL